MLSSAEELKTHLGCHSVISRLLWNRGFRSVSSLESLFKLDLLKLPNPYTIIDLKKAVERTVSAILKNEKIVVYGDYDVDGTCGSALLFDFFREIGVGVECYQPDRFKEGYGVHTSAVENLVRAGTKLIITVDCGITAIEPAELAQSQDVDMIILDHHQLSTRLPSAFAVVNPQRSEDESGLKNVCGAGLAFFFVMGLRTALRNQGFFTNIVEPNLLQFLDLVAVATVADMVDIRGVNRIFISHGLRILHKNPRLGFKAILEKTKITKPSTFHCGFILGPRINAAGRLKTAKAALELLTCKEPKTANTLVDALEAINSERKQTQEEVHRQARECAQLQLKDPIWKNLAQDLPASRFGPWPRALVLAPQDGCQWHEGVVGIVASKIVEEFHLPTIVLTQSHVGLKGSMRSLPNIDILAQVSAESVARHLTNFGGHAHAGGLALEHSSLEDFKKALNFHMALNLDQTHYKREMRYDLEIDLSELSEQLLIELEMLEPFGRGFAEPIFKVVHTQPLQYKLMKEKHLKLRLGKSLQNHSYDAVWFNAIGPRGFADVKDVEQLKQGCALWVTPQWNEWQGSRKMQLQVKHLELT